jgi:NAD(P)-dependent dehydrogenase (short-subunit alcohol dehydrogenase family)
MRIHHFFFKGVTMSKVLALVGMGPGVSAAVARRFGREGYVIAAISRRPEALQEQVAELRSTGISAAAYPGNAADPEGLAATLGRIATDLGPVDVLVYNAAGIRHKPLAQLTAAELVDDLAISVVGALTATQAVLPSMRARSHGSLLFTGGGFALEPEPDYPTVGIGKAALRNLVFSLFADLRSTGVHAAILTIAGFVKPDTAYDPERIADRFWALHSQPANAFERELVLSEE